MTAYKIPHNIALQAHKPNAVYRKALTTADNIVMTVVASMNEIIDSYILNLIPEVRKAGLFKREVKQNILRSQTELRKCVRKVSSCYTSRNNGDLYFDFVDYAESQLSHDITILTMTLHNAMTTAGIHNAAVLSRIEAARILLCMCCRCFDELFDDLQRRYGIDLRTYYDSVRPSAAKHWWQEVSRLSDRYSGPVRLNLNDCPQVKLSVEVIDRKLCSMKFIEDALHYTFRNHPEYTENVDVDSQHYGKEGLFA